MRRGSESTEEPRSSSTLKARKGWGKVVRDAKQHLTKAVVRKLTLAPKSKTSGDRGEYGPYKNAGEKRGLLRKGETKQGNKLSTYKIRHDDPQH